MEIFLGLTFFFFLVFIVFMVLVFLFPEWVGITGKKAKDVLQEQADPTGAVQGSRPADSKGEEVP